MTIAAWREAVARRLDGAAVHPPRGTVYHALAGEMEAMARSYLADGDFFLSRGDHVNALAAFSYALGWLDTAVSLGLLSPGDHSCGWLFAPVAVPGEERDRLVEKAGRYGKMLRAALGCTVPAPEEGTRVRASCDRIFCACTVLLEFGDTFASRGMAGNALGAYSYGHGWLDAGVRAGLFRITGNRVLFAV
ncbi:MAG: DUF357 domain-containing protein [Methanolinea sp.]|nr:DUF357 domain-containing protein [Methanolinea sp.]